MSPKPTQEKVLTILAGPNGAGKTTFARRVYPDLIEKGCFLNADLFAEEMQPEDVASAAIRAGKQFLEELDKRLEGSDPILIETTMSGQTLLRKIKQAKEKGFLERLIFLRLRTVSHCDFRVKGRVASGGHNIPYVDIKRRYERGIKNLPVFMEAVDEYEVFLAIEEPVLISSKTLGQATRIHAPDLFAELQDAIE